MFLQRLVERAGRLADLPPPMYQEQPIRYVVDLTPDGRMLGAPVDTSDAAVQSAKRGVRMLAPHLKRANGIRPKLLADTGVYAFGLPTEKDRPERVAQQRAAFADLVDACAEATEEITVRAVATFLHGIEDEPAVLPEGFDASANLTFRVAGVFPIDLPTVRTFWANRTGVGEDDGEDNRRGTGRPQCLVCGHYRPVLTRHPLKLKGIPGGQTVGTDLISANEAAFESYGLAASLIAPTCQICAEAYGNALNDLLANDDTSIRLGQSVSVFWTARPTGFSPKRALSTPTPEEVRELLAAFWTGRAAAVRLDPTAFYALGLSASGGRAVVSSWLDSTVGEAKYHLGRWFLLQALVDPYGDDGPPLPARRLTHATVRDPKKEDPAERVVEGLLELALAGTPPPLEILFAAVKRCRAAQGVTRERAALIKIVLAARPELTGERLVSERLDPANTDPAYLCGRLLAVLDAIQRRALNNPNATIVDKFYGTASSAPGAVFGTLLHGARPHLAKLRKDLSTRSTANALEARLEDVVAGLHEFPRTLTLPQQGLFALGFYHQRADDRRAAKEGAARRRTAATDDASTDDADATTPEADNDL